jgi:DNA anti-recombination protein RmuC
LEKLVSQGLEIRMYVKKFADYYLLTQSHIQDANFSIDFVLKLSRNMSKSVETMEPLDLLHIVISKFGLIMQIGNQQAKFV